MVLLIQLDKDVTKDIDKIDTSNNVLALKEYRHFFQYLFVNKKSMSSMKILCRKIMGLLEKPAVNLLICTDLKNFPATKRMCCKFLVRWRCNKVVECK